MHYTWTWACTLSYTSTCAVVEQVLWRFTHWKLGWLLCAMPPFRTNMLVSHVVITHFRILYLCTSMNALTSHCRYVWPDEQWKKPTCLFKFKDSHSRLVTGIIWLSDGNKTLRMLCTSQLPHNVGESKVFSVDTATDTAKSCWNHVCYTIASSCLCSLEPFDMCYVHRLASRHLIFWTEASLGGGWRRSLFPLCGSPHCFVLQHLKLVGVCIYTLWFDGMRCVIDTRTT